MVTCTISSPDSVLVYGDPCPNLHKVLAATVTCASSGASAFAGIGRNQLSSFMVPNGLSMTMYTGSNFDGNSIMVRTGTK